MFSLIPLPYRVAIGVALCLALFVAWQMRWTAGFDAGVSNQKAKQAVIDDQRKQLAIDELAKRKQQDDVLHKRVQEAEDEAFRAMAAQRADKVIADAASGELRRRFEQRLRDLVSAVHATASARDSGANNPAAAASSPSAEDPARMLADVYGRCLQQRQRYAEIADDRGRAGKLCEAAYDALTASGQTAAAPGPAASVAAP